MEQTKYIVQYERWCGKCKYKAKNENDELCEECLSNPITDDGSPLKYDKD
mgnify:CR=1 FL=1